jgi:hypothetical protein
LKSPAVAQAAAHPPSRAEAAAPTATGVFGEQQVLLSTLPPSRGQARLAFAIGLVGDGIGVAYTGKREYLAE